MVIRKEAPTIRNGLCGLVVAGVLATFVVACAEEQTLNETERRLDSIGYDIVSRIDFFRENHDQWPAEKLEDPYPGAAVPIERESIEWTIETLKRLNDLEDEAYWRTAPKAFEILNNACLTSAPPQLMPLCRDALRKNFPVSWRRIENALDMAVRLIGKLGDEDDLAFLKSTERPEFWAERLAGRTLGVTHPIAYEPDGEMLYFRSLAPRNLAYLVPRRAHIVIDPILERRTDSPAYIAHIEELKREADEGVRKADAYLRQKNSTGATAQPEDGKTTE